MLFDRPNQDLPIYTKELFAQYMYISARECISMRLKYISMSRARQYARAHLIHRVYSAGTRARAKKTSRDTTDCAVLSESRAGAHWATNQNASNLALSCRQARTWVFALGARSVVATTHQSIIVCWIAQSQLHIYGCWFAIIPIYSFYSNLCTL